MTRRLLVATGNRGKLAEFAALLPGVAVLGLADVGVGDLPETGETFEDNARQKATEAARRAGVWCLADDSGLCVDALDGAPGVNSARYAGRHGDDSANRALLLERLAAVPEGGRSARFVCVLVLVAADGEVLAEARGECPGRIVHAPRGELGFGYDPVFVPDGDTRTMAELPSDEKNARSHRGRALEALLPALRARLAAE